MTTIPPTVLWDDEPVSCLRVNVEWRTHVIGLLGRGLKNWYWDANQLEGEDGINEIINNLATVECLQEMVYTIDRVIVKHEVAQNSHGGATVANVLTRFPYNVLATDDTGDASLAGNILLLPAGLWRIHAEHIIGAATAADCKGVLTGTGDVLTPNYRLAAGVRNLITLETILEIFTPTNIDFRYYITVAQATSGLGLAMNVSPYSENYGQILCERLTLL